MKNIILYKKFNSNEQFGPYQFRNFDGVRYREICLENRIKKQEAELKDLEQIIKSTSHIFMKPVCNDSVLFKIFNILKKYKYIGA